MEKPGNGPVSLLSDGEGKDDTKRKLSLTVNLMKANQRGMLLKPRGFTGILVLKE
jgi:hypothetical protein